MLFYEHTQKEKKKELEIKNRVQWNCKQSE